MGRSRGGLTTKIHALVDAEGLPIALKLTEGQAHDGRSATDMLASIKAGQILLADRAYDSDALRQDLASRGAWANVKPMPNRKNVPAFSGFLYRYRNLVERFFNKSREDATRIMLHVHQNGVGECGIFTYEVAETKVTQVMDFARKHQHPLQCVMEKK